MSAANPLDRDRPAEICSALIDLMAGAGKTLPGRNPRGAAVAAWPLILVDAVLRSEAAGDANRQDELIEAIATLLGLPTDKELTVEEAAAILSQETLIEQLQEQRTAAEREAARSEGEHEDAGVAAYQHGRSDVLGEVIDLLRGVRPAGASV